MKRTSRMIKTIILLLLGVSTLTWRIFESLQDSIYFFHTYDDDSQRSYNALVMYYDDNNYADEVNQDEEGEVHLLPSDKSFTDSEKEAVKANAYYNTIMEAADDGAKDQEEDYTAVENAALNVLNPVNFSLYPIYTNGCCGIGHRLSRIIPTIVYANLHNRKAKIYWPDVGFDALFESNEYFEASSVGQTDQRWKKANELGLAILNDSPKGWSPYTNRTKYIATGTVLDKYRSKEHWLDNPWIFAVLIQMKNSLSPLGLSYLNSIRDGIHKNIENENIVSICVHVRQGNAEKGDWQNKKHRHSDVEVIINATVNAMQTFAIEHNASSVSVFIASDNNEIRPKFQRKLSNLNGHKTSIMNNSTNVEVEKHLVWDIIVPNEVERPKEGVWFGQINKDNSRALNQEKKNEVMAEATAQVFGLGECDTLMIPTYSTFNLPAIALTAGRKKPVYFGQADERTHTFVLKEVSSLKHFYEPVL